MRTVSFQGATLTASDRLRLEQQRRSFLNPILAASVDAAIEETEQRKAAGIRPPRQWSLERHERGTPFVGDAFNFGATYAC
jgi:hypothetical protein